MGGGAIRKGAAVMNFPRLAFPALSPEEISVLKECAQCGQQPGETDLEDRLPEMMVLAENFGEPWKWGVKCGICGRVADGSTRAKAVEAWNAGGHSFNIDPDTGDIDEEREEGS